MIWLENDFDPMKPNELIDMNQARKYPCLRRVDNGAVLCSKVLSCCRRLPE